MNFNKSTTQENYGKKNFNLDLHKLGGDMNETEEQKYDMLYQKFVQEEVESSPSQSELLSVDQTELDIQAQL